EPTAFLRGPLEHLRRGVHFLLRLGVRLAQLERNLPSQRVAIGTHLVGDVAENQRTLIRAGPLPCRQGLLCARDRALHGIVGSSGTRAPDGARGRRHDLEPFLARTLHEAAIDGLRVFHSGAPAYLSTEMFASATILAQRCVCSAM